MEAELREAVPDDELQLFDELLAEARLVYRLRDERGLYSDSAAVGLLRLALIELGRRMFEAGRINFMYDTLDLTARRRRCTARRVTEPDRRRTLGTGGDPQARQRRGCPGDARSATSTSAARRSASAAPRGG